MSADTARPAASRPRRLTRARAVLLTVLLAGAVFLTTTQTWVHATLTSGTVRSIDAAVTGSDAARGVTALALVALAGAVAVSIAGRVARIVIGVLIVLAGAGAAATSLGVLADPAAAADGKIASQSGVTGGDIAATPTGWIAVAVAAAVLLALCGVLVLVAGRRWDATRRFEATPAGTGPAPAASDTAGTARPAAPDVDAPNRGGSAGGAAPAAGATSGSATPGTAARGSDAAGGSVTEPVTGTSDHVDEPVDDIDSWDRLTRGQDPTA